jgi:hypothetical protein
MMKINMASKTGFNYTISLNDVTYFQYHRNNGVTKLGLVEKDLTGKKPPKTNYMLRSPEGALMLSDRMNNAYIRSVFNDTYVISGQQFMPFNAQLDKEVQKIINFIGVISFPVCISLCLPVFLHHLVMEKETRLVDNMKINGLKMFNYWLVNGIYNFFSFALTAVCYIGFGRYVDLNFFVDTHILIFVQLLFCWGLCQVALSMFFCSLFSEA